MWTWICNTCTTRMAHPSYKMWIPQEIKSKIIHAILLHNFNSKYCFIDVFAYIALALHLLYTLHMTHYSIRWSPHMRFLCMYYIVQCTFYPKQKILHRILNSQSQADLQSSTWLIYILDIARPRSRYNRNKTTTSIVSFTYHEYAFC